ncbi:MAG TPA: hypothetical protein VGS06_27800 [Streptosporangiaceae bacterium]|nr:hypothetical protein [Streptosporangiaceae bacterium]
MSVFQNQDQRSSGRLPRDGASCAPPPTRGRGASRVAGSYLRVTGPVLRGPAGVLAAGYGLEQAVAARTGRRILR